MKLQGSALRESYNDPRIAPVPGNKGRYFTLIARLQFMTWRQEPGASGHQGRLNRRRRASTSSRKWQP